MLNKINSYLNSHVWLLLSFLAILSFGIRLYQLNQVPATLTHDETVYAIQAKSLSIQGKTWDQKLSWFPITPIDPWYAEWPASIIAPFFWVTSNPLLAVHLPSAIMGAIIPFLLGALVWLWWKDKSVALFTILVSIFNPFLWQYSRLSYDAIFSTFFYLAGAVVLLGTKKYWKLASIPLFVLGFFEYQGLKLLLVPWVLGVLLIYWLSNDFKSVKEILKRVTKSELLVIASVFLLTLIYGFLLLPHQNVDDRLRFTIWNDTKFLSAETNTRQRLSLASPITRIQANKFTIMLDFMVTHFFSTFDPQRLFISLSPSVSGYSVWRHGLFYPIDALFLLVGLGVMVTDKKKLLSKAAFLLLVAGLTLPAVINTQNEWYELRAFLVYTLMPVAAGFGLYYFSRFKKIFILLLGVYVVSILSFGFHYFVRYPVYSADYSHFSDNVVVQYVQLNQKVSSKPIRVVLGDGLNAHYLFSSYLLYSSAFNRTSVNQIAKVANAEEYVVGNVTFKAGCLTPEDMAADTLVYESGIFLCQQPDSKTPQLPLKSLDSYKSIAIPAINDSGVILKIVGDKVCSGQKLPRFIWPQHIEDFSLSKLSAPDFCQHWMSDVSGL